MGRIRHKSREHLPRHCHREAFAAIILKGAYVEAGDRGRMRVSPGDVILHGSYESHLDLIAANGAEVLVLPYVDDRTSIFVAHISDPDALARLAERDLSEAAHRMTTHLVLTTEGEEDWPDQLARDLRLNPNLGILEWAEKLGLWPESISRGFRRAYGVAPQSFRARMRTLKALALIEGQEPLADVALSCGFSDQAHLSRSIRQLTGYTPRAIRLLQGDMQTRASQTPKLQGARGVISR
jgi:AraC-like DNA-binding protein